MRGVQPVLDQYRKEDLWNADETALFWRMSTGKTFTLEHETALRGTRKQMKSRVTILLCCSMEGEKIPLLCIGTAAKPRWPIVLGRRANAPIPYTSSKKGWMTRILFDRWLLEFEQKMRGEKRRVLLLVDNCPSHVGLCEKFDGLARGGHLRLIMLPKNYFKTAAMDQGVIRSLKCHYRQKLSVVLLTKIAKNVSLYEALQMVEVSWNQVTSEVIKNCWGKSGLRQEDILKDLDMGADQGDNEVLEIEAIEDQEPVGESCVVDIEQFMDNFQYQAMEEVTKPTSGESGDSDCEDMMGAVEVNRGLSSVDSAYRT